jgi:PST family polysaccharide transporter
MSDRISLRSGSWLVLDNVSAALIAFGFLVLSARVLSPHDFGVAALVVSISQVVLQMIDSLFHDAIIQRNSLEPEDVGTAMTTSILWSVLLAVLLWAAAPGIAAAVDVPSLATFLPWIIPAILASGASAVPMAMARRTMNFRSLAIRTIIARLVSTAAGAAMLAYGLGVTAVVAQAVGSVVLGSLLLILMTRPPFRFLIVRERLVSLLRFAGPAVGAQVLVFAGSRLMTLVAAAALGPAAAGIWSVALRFVEPFQVMLSTIIGHLMLPVYSRSQDNLVQLRDLFLTATRRASYLTFPLFLGLAACSDLLIRLFLGPQWEEAVLPMVVICLTIAVISSRQLVETAMLSIGMPQANLAMQGLAILLQVAGFVVGARYGLLEATVGWSLRALPFVVLGAFYLRSRLSVGFRDQLAVLAPALAAGAAMALAVGWTQDRLAGWHPGPVLLVVIPLGILTYGLLLLTLDGRMRDDLRRAADHYRSPKGL